MFIGPALLKIKKNVCAMLDSIMVFENQPHQRLLLIYNKKTLSNKGVLKEAKT